MQTKNAGIHHVTAIVTDAQRNIQFYAGLLGLRLVKVTVNFDDPGTYHFYYGDAEGNPGSIVTFFPWPAGALHGRRGTGQVTTLSLLAPSESMGYWTHRLKAQSIDFEGPYERFDELVVGFADPDGIELEIVAHTGGDSLAGWENGEVPQEHALRGLHGVTLSEEGYQRTADLLAESLGFDFAREAGNRYRFESGEGTIGGRVDLLCRPEGQRGSMGAGTVHHVAFRTPDESSQLALRDSLLTRGLNVTPVQDRNYFRSIYFKEPGGVIFEVATDGPGFDVDEPQESLGTRLMLPSWMESRRAELEQKLPRISTLKGGAK